MGLYRNQRKYSIDTFEGAERGLHATRAVAAYAGDEGGAVLQGPGVSDRLELRELAYQYARALDRRDWALARSLFTSDAVLLGPGFELHGAERIARGMRVVERFRATFHAVHNQQVEVDGDRASGETYCVASHLYERDGRARKLDWGIRYQDRYLRANGAWRFARRELCVDWEQDLPLEL